MTKQPMRARARARERCTLYLARSKTMKTENTQAATAGDEIARTVEINYRKYCAVGICATVRRGNLATEALEYSLALREVKESGRYKMRPFADALAGTRNIDHVFDDYTGDTYSRPVALVKCEALAKSLELPVLPEEVEALAKWREQQKQKEAEKGGEKGEAVKKAPLTLQARIGRAVSGDKKATAADKLTALADCMAAYDKPLAEVVKLALMDRDTLAALARYAAEAVKYRAMSAKEQAAEKKKEAAEAEAKKKQALAAAVGFRAEAKKEMGEAEQEAARLATKNAARLAKEAAKLNKEAAAIATKEAAKLEKRAEAMGK